MSEFDNSHPFNPDKHQNLNPEDLGEELKLPNIDFSVEDMNYIHDVIDAHKQLSSSGLSDITDSKLFNNEELQKFVRKTKKKSDNVEMVVEWLTSGGFNQPGEVLTEYFETLTLDQKAFMLACYEMKKRRAGKDVDETQSKIIDLLDWNEKFEIVWSGIMPEYSADSVVRLNETSSEIGQETTDYFIRPSDPKIPYGLIIESADGLVKDISGGKLAKYGSSGELEEITFDQFITGEIDENELKEAINSPYYYIAEKLDEPTGLSTLQEKMVEIAIARCILLRKFNDVRLESFFQDMNEVGYYDIATLVQIDQSINQEVGAEGLQQLMDFAVAKEAFEYLRQRLFRN